MLGRRTRACLSAVVVVALLVPAVGSQARPKSELERAKTKLERVEKQNAADEAEAQRLKDEIDRLSRQITQLQIEMNARAERIADLQQQVRDARARIEAAQVEIDKIEGAAIEQATELYKSGSTEVVDALLSSTSLSELNDRIELLGVATQEGKGALIRFSRLQARIEYEHREVFNLEDRLQAEVEARAKQQAQLEQDRKKLAKALDQLESQLARQHEREGNLEFTVARMTGKLQELQAKRAVEALGVSSQGFIWPLNGGVTSGYGYRWGRMHSGIDIDGYSGQIVVSSKEGTVILASYYSGYGQAVIVDHGGGYATLYAHLSDLDVSDGQHVEQGQAVGNVGCTGSCTGDHLHFEVRVNGSPRNPMHYLP